LRKGHNVTKGKREKVKAPQRCNKQGAQFLSSAHLTLYSHTLTDTKK